MFLEQFDKVCRGSGLKPVRAEFLLVKCIQDTERVIHARRIIFAEMVSVVVLFQHSIGIFRLYTEIPGHGFNILGQIAPDLLLRQSADVIVSRIHGDVVKVVQIAEHADLAELRDSGQEGKLYVSVA